jgi:hypothetical protein
VSSTGTAPHRDPKQVSGPVKRTLAALLIVLALSACDNVDWGGMQVEVVTPGAAADSTSGEPEAEIATPGEPDLPLGPVLFMASREGNGPVEVRPVAEIAVDSLRALPLDQDDPGFRERFAQRRMAPGTALTLFAEGTRVGTLRVGSVDFRPGRCGPVPVASGVVELIPEAADVAQFIALPPGVGLPQAHDPFLSQQHTYDQRVAGLELAAEAISRAAAPWPGSVLETRADMQAIPIDGDRTGAIAGTFLYQDALRVGTALTRAAYGIFILGTGGPSNYGLAHMDYRPVSAGKAAMRFFEQADWDGDGETELLLEVFGEETTWPLALDRRDGVWTPVYEELCTVPGTGP